MLRLRVSWTAARASGASTPITGTSSACCRSPRAVAVAELQATTTSLTSSRTSQPAISRENLRSSSAERPP